MITEVALRVFGVGYSTDLTVPCTRKGSLPLATTCFSLRRFFRRA